MSNRERIIIIPIVAVFFMHGLLYYAFPEYHYLSNSGKTGWIPIIKYLCIMLAIPFLLPARFNINQAIWAAIGISLIATSMLTDIYWIYTGNTLLLQFQIPMLAYFFAPFSLRFFASEKRKLYALYAVLIMSFTSILLEFFWGGNLLRYSISGFRAVGPFVNPNNSGILIAVAAVTLHSLTKGVKRNVFVAFIAAIALILTGSKTAIVIYLFGIVISINTMFLLFTSSGLIIGATIFSSKIFDLISRIEIREFSFESGNIRGADIENFIVNLGRLRIDQLAFGFSSRSIVDNAYLDILSFGGLYLLIIFLLVQLFSIFLCIVQNHRLLLLLHSLFILAMMTTNLMRLWPNAYVFWALIGVTFLKAFKSIEIDRLPNTNTENRGNYVY